MNKSYNNSNDNSNDNGNSSSEKTDNDSGIEKVMIFSKPNEPDHFELDEIYFKKVDDNYQPHMRISRETVEVPDLSDPIKKVKKIFKHHHELNFYNIPHGEYMLKVYNCKNVSSDGVIDDEDVVNDDEVVNNDDDGELHIKGQYIKGVKSGVWLNFNNRVRETYNDFGKLIKHEKFNINGKPQQIIDAVAGGFIDLNNLKNVIMVIETGDKFQTIYYDNEGNPSHPVLSRNYNYKQKINISGHDYIFQNAKKG